MNEEKQQANALLKAALKEFDDKPYTECETAVSNIKTALKNGADVNLQDKNGNTLLHIVAGSKKIKTYNAYIHMTLETHAKFKEEYTLDLPLLIGQYNPNPFIKNNQGLTASFVAAMNDLKKESQMVIAYESAYKAKAHSEAFKAMSDIIQGQQYKKVEQVVQLGNDSGIIERYHATDHQPQIVVSAKQKLKAISSALQGEIMRGERDC